MYVLLCGSGAVINDAALQAGHIRAMVAVATSKVQYRMTSRILQYVVKYRLCSGPVAGRLAS